MKKKILLLSAFSVLLFSSCNNDDDALTNQSKELNSLEENYEAHLKGVTITGPKDEKTPSDGIETRASEEYLQKIQNELENSFSKVTTRANSTDEGYVGVLKYSTCGSYREFKYHQDHEDGGWTRKSGDIGATAVDRNGNTNWVFCLVPGMSTTEPNKVRALRNYGGGVLCLNTYKPTVGDYTTLVYRWHDDDDNKNKNQINNNGGLIMREEYIGRCRFFENTVFVWQFTSNVARTTLPFKYGVISNNAGGSTYLYIDDENGKNANSTGRNHIVNGVESQPISTWFGMEVGDNTKYYITAYN